MVSKHLKMSAIARNNRKKFLFEQTSSSNSIGLTGVTVKTNGAGPPNFEVSISNLEFSNVRYGQKFQSFPSKFTSSKKHARQSLNYPLNIPFFIWSLFRWSGLFIYLFSYKTIYIYKCGVQ